MSGKVDVHSPTTSFAITFNYNFGQLVNASKRSKQSVIKGENRGTIFTPTNIYSHIDLFTVLDLLPQIWE
jgi:hypothetical protein